MKADLILTDSGGIQEEAPALDKPVLILREITERQEGVFAGNALLVGGEQQTIIDGVKRLLEDSDLYSDMANSENPYGDGKASSRIIAALAGFPKLV